MASIHIGRWLFGPGRGLHPGYLLVADGVVEEICTGTPPGDSTPDVVLPAFVNAHTHIGDSVAYPAPRGTVADIVGPGGYKHRVLEGSSPAEKAGAMRASLELMASTGTCMFADFREEGVEGVRALRGSMAEGHPGGTVLGRPTGEAPTEAEIDALLDVCDGIGISAARDHSEEFMEEVSSRTLARRKLLAIHASEAVREDIDRILDLKPSFLVHMTAASDDDLEACASAGVPIVMCPRSNLFFGLRPDLLRMLRAGVEGALGTDNAMICPPNMLDEMQAAFAIGGPDGLSPGRVASLASLGGHKVLNAKGKITTEIDVSDDLVAIRTGGEDPLSRLMTAATAADITAVIQGGRIRRPRDWTR
jgi:cytosine/adenosine deaminase-related metal-dependent hydrolase